MITADNVAFMQPLADHCPACTRWGIFVHSARIMRDHDRAVIAQLQAKLAEAEAALKAKKGKA